MLGLGLNNTILYFDLLDIPSSSGVVTETIMELDSFYIRKTIRNSIFVIDKTLTLIGFSGIENTDWENISQTIL